MKIQVTGLILISFLAFVLPAAASKQAIPSLTGPVIDETGILQTNEVAELAGLSRTRKNQELGQVQVLVIRSLNGESIEEYANQVFHTWGLGQKGVDDGVLILVALDDHKMRIEVGRGLEGAIPDIYAKQITADEMAPYFRNAQYFEGLKKGIYSVNRLIDGEKLQSGIHKGCRYEVFGICFSYKEVHDFTWLMLLLIGVFIFSYPYYRSRKTIRDSYPKDYTYYDPHDSNQNSSSGFFDTSNSSGDSSGGDWSGGGGDSGGGGASSDW